MARDCAISRRSFVATSGVLAGLAAAGAASAPTFSKADDAAAAYEEGVTEVWGHCAINCPGRCALKFHVKDGEVLWVDTYSNPTNDLDDPQPRACLRGRSYRRWMNNPDRINYPMKRVEGTKRGDGQYEQISWDEALQTIAEKLKYTIDTYGNEAVYNNYATGVSATTARPLNRLMNLLGGRLSYYGSYSTAEISWITPYVYGSTSGSTLSAMEDSDLVLCFGSSPSETRQGGAVSHHDWVRGREYTKGKVYIIDPRMNDSAMGHSGQWLPINPGTDAALVSAIAHELIVNDQVDHEFLDIYCVGFDESTMPESAKGQNKSYTDYIMGTGYDMVEKTPEWAAPLCGISADRIRSLTEEIAAAEHMFVFQGWGPQRRSNGEMNGMSICMLPLLTGNIGLPGTSTGLREGSRSFGLKSMPAGDNPVKTKISVFSMVDAIDHGTEMTEVADGVKGKEKLDTNIKFVFNYAGNCITNQNSDINHVHDVMSADTKCEFVVGSDIVMCDSMKYCDIILPDMFRFEQDSMIATGGDDAYMICGQPCLPEVKFERKTNYEWVSELAELMGVGEEFTEGKTEREWIDSLYEAAREEKPELPPLEVFRDLGVVTQKSEAPLIALEAFRADPVANPLMTPSGKIEIYSEALDQYIQTHEFADDDFVAPVPVYATEWYGVETTTDEYPLVCSGFHYRGRLHSSWGFDEQLKAANPQEAWINPVDAEERGIAQGDTIRVKNQFGEIELLAKVTGRTTPGVVCISQGAWHDADMNGDRVDKGGSINTLTTLRPSPLAKGNPQHTNICQVTKA